VHKGDRLHKTIDLLTAPGAIQLIHEDPTVLMQDYKTLHELCSNKELYKLEDVYSDDEENNLNLTDSCHTFDMHSFESPPKTPDIYTNNGENNSDSLPIYDSKLIEVSSELSLHTVVPNF